MDRRRLQELKDQRRRAGLSLEEANELGRLLAQEAGAPYSNGQMAQAAAREARLRPLPVRAKRRSLRRRGVVTA